MGQWIYFYTKHDALPGCVGIRGEKGDRFPECFRFASEWWRGFFGDKLLQCDRRVGHDSWPRDWLFRCLLIAFALFVWNDYDVFWMSLSLTICAFCVSRVWSSFVCLMFIELMIFCCFLAMIWWYGCLWFVLFVLYRWHCPMLWRSCYLCHSQWEWNHILFCFWRATVSSDDRKWFACLTSTSSVVKVFGVVCKCQDEGGVRFEAEAWYECFLVEYKYMSFLLLLTLLVPDFCLVISQAPYFDWKHQEADGSRGEPKGKAKPLDKRHKCFRSSVEGFDSIIPIIENLVHSESFWP